MIRLHILMGLSKKELDKQLKIYSKSGWQKVNEYTWAGIDFNGKKFFYAYQLVNIRQP